MSDLKIQCRNTKLNRLKRIFNALQQSQEPYALPKESKESRLF